MTGKFIFMVIIVILTLEFVQTSDWIPIYMITRSRVKEYLPIVGLAEYNKLSAKLILGADRCISPLFYVIN